MTEYKVLVPLDGSRLAERSLSYLPALRKAGELKLMLTAVVDDMEAIPSLSTAEVFERERNVMSTYLREIATDIEKHLGVAVETSVRHGIPADCVLERVETFKPDLLILSTHGRSGFSRWRLGSVADKLIRGATCPTLVIGPKAPEEGVWLEAQLVEPFKRLLVPLDGSELAEAALATVQFFREHFGSEVHLVRAVPIPTIADGMAGQQAYTPQLLETLLEGAEDYLQNTRKRLGATGGVSTKALAGSAASALEAYVSERDIDLVVMTSHGRGGILRTALGSVTDRMLGGAAPVLVVHPQQPL